MSSRRSWWRGVVRSRTMLFAAALGVLGVLEQSRGVLEPFLKEHTGLVLMLIAIAVAILRVLTTSPLQEKGPGPKVGPGPSSGSL